MSITRIILFAACLFAAVAIFARQKKTFVNRSNGKKWNWWGIVGIVLAVACIIPYIVYEVKSPSSGTVEHDPRFIYLNAVVQGYMAKNTFYALCALWGGGLLSSIIGLFFKSRKLAVIGLLILPFMAIPGWYLYKMSGF
jgi:NADH:ubiquinone oxidoreductase subunit 6 (subunit J)